MQRPSPRFRTLFTIPAFANSALVAAVIVGVLCASPVREGFADEVAGSESSEQLPKAFPPLYEPTRFPLDFVTDRSDLDGSPDFDCYFGLLDYARRVDPTALEAAAGEIRGERWKDSEFADWPLEEFPFYYDLTKRPAAYRGKPITLTGHIQVHHVDHVENDFHLDPIHVAYLYTDDSQHHPARIVFTENPDGVPVGEQVVSGIRVTGYFLKLYRYKDRDGQGRFMPVLLARSVRWSPPEPAEFSYVSQVAMGAGALAIIAGVLWWVTRNRQRDAVARKREREMLGNEQPPDFSTLS